MIRAVTVLLTFAVSIGLVLGPAAAQTGPTTFLETFDGSPAAPKPFSPPGWDVSVIGSLEPMWANHGPDCSPPDERWPGGQPNAEHNHFITSDTEVVFGCRDHIMTAMNAGYGAVYLTPPALMDLSRGPATFEWDMSTERTSSRDWIDIVIQPFQDGFDGPMALNMQDFHTPRRGIQIELQGSNVFAPHVFLDGPAQGCGPSSYWKSNVYYCRFQFDGFNTWERKLAEEGLSVSAARRDHFVIELSPTHLRVGFRTPGGKLSYWTDADIPGGRLGFSQAVVQLNQRAYNPLKPCGPGVGDAGHSDQGWQGGCRAGTWHIDNVKVSPSIPFTIESGSRGFGMPGGTVTFPQALAVDGFVKAAGAWSDTEYSLDGGHSWRVAPIVGPKAPLEVGDSYWIPVPAGTRAIALRGSHSRWAVQDVYLYAKTGGSPAPAPTGVPTSTSTALPTVTASATPTPEPTATSTPELPTSTPTPEPTATSTPVPLPPMLPLPTLVPPPVDQPAMCALVQYDPESGWTVTPRSCSAS